MAIHQFKLNLIPEKGVLDILGMIPPKLDINFEERIEHYHLKKDNLLESSDFFEDALSIDWWDSIHVSPTEIIYYISKLFPTHVIKNSNSYYWKYYIVNSIDHDASLVLDKQSEKIEELYFRADLRESGLVFLNQFIEIAKKYNCLLLDVKGNLIRPERNEVYKLITLSDNYRFLVNPEDFLNNLRNQQ
ncbi:hypothetical protein CEY12_19550 [Chryseobacterium sp. T16E-39]|uniref:hypothetical protein n=1 Tax=Chryseobacterium sp. T16E-39 TaxID=2015076 RepID=UPI000B5B1A17|nr:hypothetical protein [Chryseobacterium sp. T16E-39]ASK32157.1 hypothetical protein CEY12_19550 [Chryseobacterium sp. T16E-39]